jgi:RNA-directed DNA polymerase
MISKRTDEAEALARGTDTQGAGRKSSTGRFGAEVRAATFEQTKSEDRLMEQVVERSNLWSAYQRVVKNKGAPRGR